MIRIRFLMPALIAIVTIAPCYGQTIAEQTTDMIRGRNMEVSGITVLGHSTARPLSTPPGYSLYVGKGILTEKLKVANSGDGANWSDFVFDADYELMPLTKVEAYVKQNHHLPEIPSADEVAKDGIDVAAMDAKLLQKIEELTLYVISQQKEIEALKQQMKTLVKK